MSTFETFPAQSEIDLIAKTAKPHMRPNTKNPHAVIMKEFLRPDECDAIVNYMLLTEEPYNHGACDSSATYEAPRPLSAVFLELELAGRIANDQYWRFDLDAGPSAWMQEYREGAHYRVHIDGCPGFNRKLTAVVQLSDPTEYEGGDLNFLASPESMTMPRDRGSIVVFPPWLLHEVTPVTSGLRRTINMGFWGPAFK